MKTIDEALEAMETLIEHYVKRSIIAIEQKDIKQARIWIERLKVAKEAMERLNPEEPDGGCCPECGELLDNEDYYCRKCGQAIARDENSDVKNAQNA